MQKVSVLEEYQSLVGQAKAGKKSVVTNCFLFPAAVERYISLGRLFYEKADAGILFFSDEGDYLQCYYYLDPDIPLQMTPKDKRAVIQNLRLGEEVSPKLQRIGERLAAAGFSLHDTMRQLRADPEQVLKKIGLPARAAGKLLDRDGFVFCAVSEALLPSVWELLRDTPEIPRFQLAYFSAEELKDQAREEQFTCILDRNGSLCAAHQFFPEGKALYGWLAIREEYKKLYGMGLVFTEHVMRYALKKGYNISGWIDLKNRDSIQYHTKIGYEFTDRYMDEWVFGSGSAD